MCYFLAHPHVHHAWSQTAVSQQDDRFIQQLSLLLAHMPKSNCLCNCAYKCIRHNVNDHHRECLPVLKEEGIKSWSCRHCVPVLCTLLKKQFKPGLTATFIDCNCLPQHYMSCTIKKGQTMNTLAGYVSPVQWMSHKYSGQLNLPWSMPLSSQRILNLMRTKIQCNLLPVQNLHIYHP